MLSEEHARIYEKLWRLSSKAEPTAAPVYWDKGGMPNREVGLFTPPQDEGDIPRIRIARDNPPDDLAEDTIPDLDGATLDELITLAHERGHEESWHAGTYPIDPPTMSEERRAWSHAERLMRALGFHEWKAFIHHRQASLFRHSLHGTPDPRTCTYIAARRASTGVR
jgi:hypothetical protein